MSGRFPFDDDYFDRLAEEPAPGSSRSAPLTVAEFNRRCHEVLEAEVGLVWVAGEVTRFNAHANGHWYFGIKDADGAAAECVMFRGRHARLKFQPKVGMALLLQVKASVWDRNGKLSLNVEQLEPAGAGAAALALEQLKQRLLAEGLFDPSRKRPLPLLPRAIGVATSLDGAALRDVLKVLRRRFAGVRVVVAGTLVQGAAAPPEIVAALAALDRQGLDVLLLVRGGGSREDLAAFDDERVVRAVALCRTPIVTGVGHEIDTTLVDLASDLRAPTPSAAAEVVVQERTALVAQVAALRGRAASAMQARLQRLRRRTLAARGRRGFQEPPRRLARAATRLAENQRRLIDAQTARLDTLRSRFDDAARRLSAETRLQRLHTLRRRAEGAQARLAPALRKTLTAARRRADGAAPRLLPALRVALSRRRQALATLAARLDALSPLKVLARGYALVTLPDAAGRVVVEAAQAPPGTAIAVRLARGTLAARVEAAAASSDETTRGTR